MSEKDRFDASAWKSIAEAPLSAGMAVFSVSHPGPIGIIKELRAANRAMKHPGDRGPANQLIAEIQDAAASQAVQDDMQKQVKSLSKDKMRRTAIGDLQAASRAIAGLPEDEKNALIDWVVDVGRATAEAASDRGESAKISDTEAEMLRTIEDTLRSG